MESLIEGIESYYKDELNYQLTRHLSLGLAENQFEYELKLTPDCPYYKDGIRALKRKKHAYFMEHPEYYYINDVYFFDVDLCFINLPYFKDENCFNYLYKFLFISNDLNLNNLVIDLSSLKFWMPCFYFFIDMSSNRLILNCETEYDMDFYQFLSWLDSGLNVSIMGYFLKCSNFHSGFFVDDDIFINDLLNNFNRLFLTRDTNNSMHFFSSNKYDNGITLHIQFFFNDSIEKFMDFISSLKSILLSCYYNNKLSIDFLFEVIFLKYENPRDYISLENLENLFKDLFDGDIGVSVYNQKEADENFYDLL